MIRWMPFEIPDSPARKRVCAWLTANGFDENRVPVDAYAAYDDEADEFVVEHFTAPRRIDPMTGDVSRVRIRRRRRAWMSLVQSLPSSQAAE